MDSAREEGRREEEEEEEEEGEGTAEERKCGDMEIQPDGQTLSFIRGKEVCV